MSEVTEYLQERGVTFVVIPHADDPGAAASAPSGFSPSDVVKTIVLQTPGAFQTHALAVIPDPEELDLVLARRAIGDSQARLASADELELAYPDYEPGALPPLPLFLQAPMYIDPSVMRRDSIVFRAGRHTLSIAISTRALVGDDPVAVTPLTLASAESAGNQER